MQKTALSCLFFLSAAFLAHADLVVVQRVEGAMQSGTMTLKFKDAKARVDVAPELSTITDGATGDVITLLHIKKEFMRIPADRSKALMEEMEKRQQSAASKEAGSPKLVPAGKKEKVENRDCEVFTWKGSGVSATYWIARDFPNYAAIAATMEKSLHSGLAALSGQITPRPGDFPGMVIKTDMLIAGQKVTTTLVSATDENLDAALFMVPADYKELPVPAFSLPAGK